MPKPKGPPSEVVSIRVPVDLLESVKEKLKDPMRDRTKYGGMKELICTLLYEWIQDKNPKFNRLDDL